MAQASITASKLAREFLNLFAPHSLASISLSEREAETEFNCLRAMNLDPPSAIPFAGPLLQTWFLRRLCWQP
jgi:hypothetical protein